MLRIMSLPISIMKNIIGGNMNFSLEEQKIGTWIDGKPVYQKTFDSTFPASVPVSTFTNLQDISNLNIKSLIYADGIYYHSSDSNRPFTMNSLNGIFSISNNYLEWYTIHSGVANQKYTCTIMYTKTTD